MKQIFILTILFSASLAFASSLYMEGEPTAAATGTGAGVPFGDKTDCPCNQAGRSEITVFGKSVTGIKTRVPLKMKDPATGTDQEP